MKLKSFGCSFIFGTDLSDNIKQVNDGGRTMFQYVPSQHTWPALLSKNYGADYECYASPGSGNLQILEQILNQSAEDNDSLFVIGWTWIDRFDYFNVEWQKNSGNNRWKTILPANTDELAQSYYKNIHSEYQDKFVNLCYIKTAIDTLKQKKIKYIMTYMDRLLFDTHYHCTPAILNLQKFVQPQMTEFENQTFLELSRNNGHLESGNWHPLEDAHFAATKIMLKTFDKQLKVY